MVVNKKDISLHHQNNNRAGGNSFNTAKIKMKTFNVYKKRDGQGWNLIGEYFSVSFEEAKKEFAKNCWNDLLNGKHGDNFIELSIEQDGVEEDGIYYEGQLFFPKSNLKDGIEFFSEDVYSWEIRDSKEFLIYDEDGLFTEETFESLEKAIECYSEEDGYKVEEKK